MISSAGNKFGIAISATVYSTIAMVSTVNIAVSVGIITNVLIATLPLISIFVPGNTGLNKRRYLMERHFVMPYFTKFEWGLT